MRILIVKLSAVGDVVHALPVLSVLREHFPDAHLAWVTHPGPANLLEGHPQLDQLIVLPRRRAQWKARGGMRRVIADLRGGAGAPRWDWAIDLQGLTKSGLASWLSRAKRRVGFAGPTSRELNAMFQTVRVRPTSTQVIDMNLELLRPLGIEAAPGSAQAVLHVTAADTERVSAWAQEQGVSNERFLVIDPFAGWPTKLWPRDRWLDIMRRAEQETGIRSLIFFGPGEQHEADDMARVGAQLGLHPVTAPGTTLREYTALLQAHAQAFVGGDTGPMHLAAAAGVPVTALYGPSDPGRNSPAFAGARYTILDDSTQPCSHTFTRTCRIHPQPGGCLAGISADQVWESLQSWLGRP